MFTSIKRFGLCLNHSFIARPKSSMACEMCDTGAPSIAFAHFGDDLGAPGTPIRAACQNRFRRVGGLLTILVTIMACTRIEPAAVVYMSVIWNVINLLARKSENSVCERVLAVWIFGLGGFMASGAPGLVFFMPLGLVFTLISIMTGFP